MTAPSVREALLAAKYALGDPQYEGEGEHTHWCSQCDHSVDRNREARQLIDAALAAPPSGIPAADAEVAGLLARLRLIASGDMRLNQTIFHNEVQRDAREAADTIDRLTAEHEQDVDRMERAAIAIESLTATLAERDREVAGLRQALRGNCYQQNGTYCECRLCKGAWWQGNDPKHAPDCLAALRAKGE